LKKIAIIMLLTVISVFSAGRAAVFALYGHSSVPTANSVNRLLAYFYYIPDDMLRNKDRPYPMLIMVPGLSGKGESMVNKEVKKFAEREHFAVIAPSFVFDENNWESKTSYQYASAWSGKALLKIVRQFQMIHRLRISKFYLFGHSAGAQFVLRFALWKPELCAACAAHASGGLIEPKRSSGVKFFVSAGTMDTVRMKKVKEFYEAARKKGIDVVYKEYNIGHNLVRSQFTDSLDFFKSCWKAENTNYLSDESGLTSDRLDEVIVYLTNGRTSQGLLREQTEKSITLQIPMGPSWGLITIPRTKIKSVRKINN